LGDGQIISSFDRINYKLAEDNEEGCEEYETIFDGDTFIIGRFL